MKTFQSYNQFESELKRERTPAIDLEKVKMEVRKAAMGSRRSVKSRRRMVGLVAAVVLMLSLGTIAWAVVNGWQLQNARGEVILKYAQKENKEFFKELDRFQLESPHYGMVHEELRESLVPGEAAYFIVTKGYEAEPYCHVLQKAEKVLDMDELKERTTTQFKVPEYLPEGYEFEAGYITFKEEDDSVAIGEALFQEAKAEGKEYAVRKGNVTKEAKSIQLKYATVEGATIFIYVTPNNDFKSIEVEAKTIDKFILDGIEVLHAKHKLYDIDEYIFVDESEGGNLTYLITNDVRGMSLWENKKEEKLVREEATEIIKSFR